MRVALVTNTCTHYRRPLFEHLARRFDTDFYFTTRGRAWYGSSFSAHETGMFRAFDGSNPARLVRALARGRYDCFVVSLVGRASLLAATAAARLAGRPIVLWVGIWHHPTTTFHRVSRPVARRLYRRMDAVIVYGSHVAEFLRVEAGRTEAVFEAPQSVDNEHFQRPVDTRRVRELRAVWSPDGAPVGCFVGRLEREKGLNTLLEALARTTVDQRLVLIGSGALEADLRALAADRALEERCVFAGPVEQSVLPTCLRAADYVLLPSITTASFREPWGLVANEALNCGVPVVATDAVGAAAGGLVVDGVTGCVVREGDVPGLALAMDRIARDSDWRLTLGANGARRVLSWNFAAAVDGFANAIRAAVEARDNTEPGDTAWASYRDVT